MDVTYLAHGGQMTGDEMALMGADYFSPCSSRLQCCSSRHGEHANQRRRTLPHQRRIFTSHATKTSNYV